MEKESEVLNLYKISHFYSENDKEDSLYIKTDIDVTELIEIIAAIHFKCESLIDDSVAVSEEHLVEILTKFYGAKDVTKEYKKQHYKFSLNKKHWKASDKLIFKKKNGRHIGNVSFLIQIDVHQARESCCGPNYEKLMEKHLPKSKEFNEFLLELKAYYEVHD